MINACITVQKALKDVVEHCPNQYAVAYAKTGLQMTGHELSVQCLYVLSNISHWRGPLASATRDVLKKYGPKCEV